MGQSAAILGEPRIGKTALLQHLASGGGLLAEPSLLVAYVDAHTFDAGFDAGRFWTAVLDPLSEANRSWFENAALGHAYRRCHERAFATEEVERFLKRVGESRQRLVVLVDEFDWLVHRNVAGQGDFFTGLRALMTGRHRALCVIAASRKQLAQLEALWREKRAGGSPPFNAFTQIHLGPHGHDEVEAILGTAGADFSPEDRRLVHALSGGYPYFVQTAASALFRAHGVDAEQRRRDAGLHLLHDASRSLEDIWSQWPADTRYVFAAVAVEHLDALGPASAGRAVPAKSPTPRPFPRSSTPW